MAEFASDLKMRQIAPMADRFYKKILFDEEPLFVSDEATLFDVWSGDMAEVLERCSKRYNIRLTLQAAKQSLWRLIPRLLKQTH